MNLVAIMLSIGASLGCIAILTLGAGVAIAATEAIRAADEFEGE